MKNKSLIIILGTIIVLGIAFFLNGKSIFKSEKNTSSATPSPSISTSKAFSVILEEQNYSGENGIAVIESENNKTLVKLKLTNYLDLTKQPAHIHVGSCEKPGNIGYPLNNVINGESETSLDVPIEEFMKKLPLVLNIHKSVEEENVYSACGLLKI